MSRVLLSGVRVRLLFLILLALAPVLALRLYSAFDDRRVAARDAKDDAYQLAQLVGRDQERLFEQSRELLFTFAQLAALAPERPVEPVSCHRALVQIERRLPNYLDLGIVGRNGKIACAVSARPGTDVSRRAFFTQAVRTKRFAIGNYEVREATRQRGISLAYPVVARGRVFSVMFATLNLDALNLEAAKPHLKAGTVFNLTDRRGTILVRHPNARQWVGRTPREAPLIRAILEHRRGRAETEGVDGVTRFYGFTPLAGDLFISVGIPKGEALAQSAHDLKRDLVVLTLVGLFALLAALLVGRLFVLRPLEALAKTARRLSAGDLAARTSLSYRSGEFGQLAETVNEMAKSLEEREQELRESITDRKRAEDDVRRLNAELEQRVAERTAQLEAANDELESQNSELELQTATLEEQQEELARANEELETQKADLERASVLVESTGEGIYGIDLEGRCTFINRSGAEMLGYAPEELVGRDMHQLAHHTREDGTRYPVEECPILQAFQTGRGVRVDSESFWRKDGTPFCVEYSSHPVLVDDVVTGAVVSFIDITDRKELENERKVARAELERALADLREEKERVETFYAFSEALASPANGVPFAVRVLRELCDLADAEVGTLYVSSAADQETLALAAVRGVDPEALPAQLVPGQGLAGRAVSEERVVSASHGETGLRLPVFGETVAVHHELHVPLRQDHQQVGVVSLARLADRPFSQDERDAIEHLAVQAGVGLANRLAFHEARRVAHLKRVVLDSTIDAIALVDLEGRITIENAAFRRLRTETLGLPEDATLWELARLMETKVVDPEAYTTAMAAMQNDPDAESVQTWELAESRRAFQRYSAPVRDADGEIIGRILVVREVTAEREAERLKDELVATVSHELRTPLTGILGFAELLVKHQLDESKRQRYLETIYSEAKRLTGLVNDFLDLQKIEGGHFALSLEPFDLAGVLRDEAMLHSAQSSEHTVEVSLSEERLVVVGERERIAQVIGNLLSNAIKYSPAGGPVEVAASSGDAVVRVSVTDSGLGIPAEQQDRLFTKFFRVDSSDTRRIGGTGLGLSLSKEIVEAHGGRIGFTSVEGKGSNFWFELPAAETHREPSQNGRSDGRALVIEDDPATAALISEQLAAGGLVVVTAATGEAGLELARREPPAVVCLDIALPGELDGWEVLAQLKANPATSHVPVVVCTGSSNRERAFALGAADFLTKPFSAELLRETVARLLPEGHRSVLVVDDEETVRNLVVHTLAAEGLELREAADGSEALEAVAEERPDAIVLDLAMPGVDGFAVLEALREKPETREIPVVVLTARTLTAEERHGLNQRAVALLEKTEYSAQELRRLVGRALGKDGA
jgi:PAS domain S-box-containing protein